MGFLYRQPIRQWRTQYGLEAVAETGTWEGDGVAAALDAGYPLVVTVDIITTPKVRGMMQQPLPVRWYTEQSSAAAMPSMLRDLEGLRTLWWLDAHLPERYQVEGPRTPMLAEVVAIVESGRDHSWDVIVADDTRLYGRTCRDGPMPSKIKPADPNDLDAMIKMLKPTHQTFFDSRDTGYLVALPKRR